VESGSSAATAYEIVAQNDYGLYIGSSYGIAAVALCGLLIWSILRTRALERRVAGPRRAVPADEDFR
jgi:heme exporter protein CcmD